jgi:tripartite-type tricarboxylate transporter receptor subunit TctC
VKKVKPLFEHRRLRACAVALLLATEPSLAFAAEAAYPSRPVRMIVPFAPAGPTDVIARVIAQNLSELWGHQVIVDNRAGAGGNIGMGLAANAPPDGYTVLVVSSSFVVNPSLYAKIPYDPYKSFIPVTNAAASPNVFTVHPSTSAKTMQEIVAAAKSNPRKYSIATPGVGTTPDLGAELLKMTTGADVVRVPYGGAGPAVAAVVGNQVQIGSTALPPTTPHIQAGRLRALAVTGAKRSAALADVPTMAEAGFKGQEADTLQGVLLPAGTPNAIVTKLHADIAKVLAKPDAKERVASLGFDIVASTPQQFAAQINSEIAKWEKVIKAAGIKAE